MVTIAANKAKITNSISFLIYLTFCIGFSSQSSAAELTFKWDANHPSENVIAYRIYWSMASENFNTFDMEEIPVSRLNDQNNPRWTLTIKDPSKDEFFYFVCTAFDNEGFESVFSDTVVTLVSETSDGNDGGCIIEVIRP